MIKDETTTRRQSTYSDAALTGTPVTASPRDVLAIGLGIAIPTLAKGVIKRRPAVVAIAERLDTDAGAVARMQALRRRHGPGPVVVPIPGRPQAILLDPAQVRAVLAGAPEPFAPGTLEKRSVLAHLEPDASLVSRPPERAPRRLANEVALEHDRPVHSSSEHFVSVLTQETDAFAQDSAARGRARYEDFTRVWHRIVRRIVLGDAARDDDALTDALAQLRSAANWGFLLPKNRSLRARVHDGIRAHLARAEPATLAGRLRERTDLTPADQPDQIAHWLFAFDAATIATFRTLMLLASHPDERAAARADMASSPTGRRAVLRACVLDCLRLWPTTPAIFRETMRDVAWGDGVMREGTHVMIFAPFFHRDDETLPYAHRFAPEIWRDEEAAARHALVPFSDGPGECPAHDLVPLLCAETIAALLERVEIAPADDRLSPERPLPGTLDPFGSEVLVAAR